MLRYLVLGLLLAGCKDLTQSTDHRSSNASSSPPGTETGAAAAVPTAKRDVPYTLHMTIVPEGQTAVTTYLDVKDLLASKCAACHTPGSATPTPLDLSVYPFTGRFASPEDAVREILSRVQTAGARAMPPPPAAALADAEVAKLKAWLDGGLKDAPAPTVVAPISQGLVGVVRYRLAAAGAGAYTSNKIPFNVAAPSSGGAAIAVSGLMAELPAGAPLDVVVAALGEDGVEVVTDPKTGLIVPAKGGLDLTLSVSETLIKQHAVDKEAPTPGGDGTLTASSVGEQSFQVQWLKAQDVLTAATDLTYAVYVSPSANMTTPADAQANGRKVQDFAAFSDAGAKVDGLTPGTTYYVTVLVKDRGGNLAVYKSLKQATAADLEPPTVDTPALVVSNVTNAGCTLTWTPAKDNNTPADHLTYQVYSSAVDTVAQVADVVQNGIPAAPPATATTSIKLMGMAPGTTYYLNVLVSDAAGNRTAYQRASVTTGAGGPTTADLPTYAKLCASRLGALKGFSCFDGQIAPITVNGVEIKANLSAAEAAGFPFPTDPAAQQRCDRPPLLALGLEGHCIPYSRFGRLDSGNPDVDAVFACRHYVGHVGMNTWQGAGYDGSSYPGFEDIAIIQHSRATGETCFFQMLHDDKSPADGRHVPAPTEDTAGFWNPPPKVADLGCYKCHDSTLWMHSPYVDQLKASDGSPLVPSGLPVNGHRRPLSMLGPDFGAWPKAVAIASTNVSDTNGKSCTSCHDVGSFNTCLAWIHDATGTPPPNGSATASSYPLNYWMPPGDPSIKTLANWNASGYAQAVQHLAACCAAPTGAGCTQQPITTPTPAYLAP